MKQPSVEIIQTGDGSHSLLNRELDETYHSRHGALQESRHVFIRMGLEYWIQQQARANEIRIFEMGLGTGLNALLTLEKALQLPQFQFSYTTLEAHPLPWETIEQLNYAKLIKGDQLSGLYRQLHQANWDQPCLVLDNFCLKKKAMRLEDFKQEPAKYDLIFYDAFAPNKQPELWTREIIEKISGMMKAGAVLVTYSAKGQLKRDLKSLGLKLSTLPGPPGKAEMIRAEKTA
jgi:tRNA U34 5-methylaminomethyl-2-thiouridine-forming methyltransferase MnmC